MPPYLKGTQIGSGGVTHLKWKIFENPVFFLLSTCVGHSSLSCETLMSFIGWQFT